MTGRDADRSVVEVAARSTIVRLLDELLDVPSLAWPGSRARRMLMRVALEFSELSASARRRTVGYGMLAATVTHMAISLATGGRPVSATLIGWLLAAGACGMLIAVSSVAPDTIERRDR